MLNYEKMLNFNFFKICCYFSYFFINNFSPVNSDEVLGCGGFLKSHVPIDFSKVELRLITKQGNVKDKTTAAPNGYYFVPLYDKGEMFLELVSPPGWSFEPQKVSLNIDGVTDLCSQGKDINFIFQGFGITGKVGSYGDNSQGPEGVPVKLESKGEERITITDKNGQFFFTPVFPGIYKVSILDSRWKAYKQDVMVNVAESNAELPHDSLLIQGYDVNGLIRSEGQPVSDVTVMLFSKHERKTLPIAGCNTSLDSLKHFNLKKKPLCYVTSNEEGKFTFGTVPNGEYYIVPNYKNQNIYFQPEQIDFVVSHKSVHLKDQFKIIGLSITGRVMKSDNVPIHKAKVFINNQETTSTDENGIYTLEKIKAGNYKIRAEYDDLLFEETTCFVSPTQQKLPDIRPSACKVCGSVTSEYSQTVRFTKEDGTVIQTETSPQDGRFCQYLPLGKYNVTVLVKEDDKHERVQFFPLVQSIEVAAKKVNDIVFSQLKSKVIGIVKCVQTKKCDGHKVVLTGSDGNNINLNVKDGTYSVENISPGMYEIRLLSDKFCWENNYQKVHINSAVVNIPPFVQKGYIVNFDSSHETKVQFKLPGEIKVLTFDIPKGKSSFCLEKPGEYSFELISCHLYQSKSVVFNTNFDTNEISLIAEKHKQKLSIQSELNVGELQVSIKIGTERYDRTVNFHNGFYELEVMLEPFKTAVVVPRSDILFFTPSIVLIEESEDCNDWGVKFVAVKGKLFKGKVTPPLAGVTITVENTDGEKLVVTTDETGSYKFPPLDTKKQYKIEAEKESYLLIGPDENGNFLAHKLAEIVVEVVTSDNKPLAGVLLSLSGGESYRKNLQTDENGKISFYSLSPGEYFLRPMMKEYIFEPNSKIIQVNEGQTVNEKLLGKRVAYSAFGKVLSLNGEPEDKIVITAVGLNNCTHLSEEVTCESNGQFRIRGLEPYCSYRIAVKGMSDKNIEGSTPKFKDVENVQEDIKDLVLTVFRPVSQMNILVKVYSDHLEYYKNLKVKLVKEQGLVVMHVAKADAALKLTKSINPGVLLHIPSVPMDNTRYSLQLESGAMLTSKFQHPPYTFAANVSFQYFEFNFTAASNITEQPIRQTSIWSLVFIFLLLVSIYNIEIVATIIKDKFNFGSSILTNFIPISTSSQKSVNDYYDDAQIDQIVQSINNAKKKPKVKKA